MIFVPFFLRVEFCLRQMYTKTVHGTLAIAKYVSGVFFVRFFDVSLRLPSVFSQQIIHHHIKIGIGPERFRFPLLSILSELMWFMGMISFARAPCFLHNNLGTSSPGDFESHYRIDQLVLHVQGPIERAVMKGFGVNILIVYVGSWDEGGMKETVFFLRREMHYENTCWGLYERKISSL